MKKSILLFLSIIWLSISSLMAQENMQRQTPEERTKITIEKMAPLNLDTVAISKTAAIISAFFTAQQNAIREMRESGNMDRDALQLKRKELAEARDAKLKGIFTEEQYQKWVNEIEPSLRPQRRGN